MIKGIGPDLCLHESGVYLAIPLDNSVRVYSKCCLTSLIRRNCETGKGIATVELHCNKCERRIDDSRPERFADPGDDRLIEWIENYYDGALEAQLAYLELQQELEEFFEIRARSSGGFASLVINLRDTYGSLPHFQERRGSRI
jgi:hypothetical protein